MKTTMNNKKCFIMGLPEAGKTTFLAALFYSLENNNSSKLKLKHYSGNHKYLSDISRRWVNTEKIPRTNPEFENQSIELFLENDLGNDIMLVFPDLSGETFQYQYEKRECRKVNYEFVQSCDGILFFIHPEKIKEPILISEVPLHLRSKDKKNAHEFVKPRNPKIDDPTQVQIVELLQIVKFIRQNNPVNMCIILSAWDLVNKELQKSPENFVKTQLPLLWQYLYSNSEYYNGKYLGLSAQGGSLENRDKLLELDPCDRIQVTFENDTKNDITIPLNLIMSNINEQ